MATPDAGGGGGVGGPIFGAVLRGMRLGKLSNRLFGGTQHLSRTQRRRLRAIPGVSVEKGQWRLPDIPGIPGQQAIFTNTNRIVRKWLRAYTKSGGAGPRVDPNVADKPYVPYIPPTDAEWQARKAALEKKAPPKPPKAPPPSPADKYPMPTGLPPVFRSIWSNLVAYAIIYALPYIVKKANESWDAYFKRWQEREAKHRAEMNRRKPGGPGQKLPPLPRAGTPRTPKPAPSVDPAKPPPITVIVRMPQPVPAAKSEPTLDPIVITAKRLPMPTALPPPVPLWQTALWNLGPPLITQLSKLTGLNKPKAKRARDPLTTDYTDVASYVDSYPYPQSAFGGDTPGTATCECPKKRKGKKKRRTVCYSGTYTERASGLTKRKRRKVTCK